MRRHAQCLFLSKTIFIYKNDFVKVSFHSCIGIPLQSENTGFLTIRLITSIFQLFPAIHDLLWNRRHFHASLAMRHWQTLPQKNDLQAHPFICWTYRCSIPAAACIMILLSPRIAWKAICSNIQYTPRSRTTSPTSLQHVFHLWLLYR